MRKLIPILFVSMMLILGTVFSASAMPIKLHVGSYGNQENGGWTSAFDQLGFFGNTTTTQYGTLDPTYNTPVVGSAFEDVGNLNVDAFKGLIAPGYDEGLGGAGQTYKAYSITATWDNLTGSVTGAELVGGYLVQTVRYNPDATLSFYIDDDVDQNFGATVCAGDDTGFGNDAGTLKIATLTITSGTGTNKFTTSGDFVSGSSDIHGKFTDMVSDFWYDNDTPPYDLYNYFMAISWEVTANLDQNTDNVLIIDPEAGDDFLFKICSDHDGTIEVGVIPEPATMLLLGSGLLGLAGISRKKKFFKKG